jgi:hypothetical protein
MHWHMLSTPSYLLCSDHLSFQQRKEQRQWVCTIESILSPLRWKLLLLSLPWFVYFSLSLDDT